MEKYYTPEIEEFHVGFEFEQFDTWGSWRKITLTKDILDYGGYISIGSGNERQKYYHNARVKYLDKEDIESLGFEYIVDSYSGYFTNGKLKIAWFWNKKGLEITQQTKNDIGGKTLFCGIVKNKSELKKIMEQLNND